MKLYGGDFCLFNHSRSIPTTSITSGTSYIETLFGKKFENLSYRELIEVIKSNDESPYIELKGYKNQKWSELLDDIMKSIVGFLNSSYEGVLILGFDEKTKTPTPIPPEIVGRDKFQVEQRVRDKVISKLESVPRASRPPILIFKVYDDSECGFKQEGFIIAIYAAKTIDVVYSYEGKVYVREGNKTRKLSLHETITLIESKRQPLIIPILKVKSLTNNRMKIELSLKNVGSMPAREWIVVMVLYKKLLSTDRKTCIFKYKYIHSSRMSLIKEDEDVKILQVERKIGWLSIFPLKRLIIDDFEVIMESCSPEADMHEITMHFTMTINTDVNESKVAGMLVVDAINMRYSFRCDINVQSYLTQEIVYTDKIVEENSIM